MMNPYSVENYLALKLARALNDELGIPLSAETAGRRTVIIQTPNGAKTEVGFKIETTGNMLKQSASLFVVTPEKQHKVTAQGNAVYLNEDQVEEIDLFGDASSFIQRHSRDIKEAIAQQYLNSLLYTLPGVVDLKNESYCDVKWGTLTKTYDKPLILKKEKVCATCNFETGKIKYRIEIDGISETLDFDPQELFTGVKAEITEEHRTLIKEMLCTLGLEYQIAKREQDALAQLKEYLTPLGTKFILRYVGGKKPMLYLGEETEKWKGLDEAVPKIRIPDNSNQFELENLEGLTAYQSDPDLVATLVTKVKAYNVDTISNWKTHVRAKQLEGADKTAMEAEIELM